MFGVQTFASIDTDIGVAIHVRDDLLRAGCLHDNHLYFVAHRRRFAVIKMIAADYTIALARAARALSTSPRGNPSWPVPLSPRKTASLARPSNRPPETTRVFEFKRSCLSNLPSVLDQTFLTFRSNLLEAFLLPPPPV